MPTGYKEMDFYRVLGFVIFFCLFVCLKKANSKGLCLWRSCRNHCAVLGDQLSEFPPFLALSLFLQSEDSSDEDLLHIDTEAKPGRNSKVKKESGSSAGILDLLQASKEVGGLEYNTNRYASGEPFPLTCQQNCSFMVVCD